MNNATEQKTEKKSVLTVSLGIVMIIAFSVNLYFDAFSSDRSDRAAFIGDFFYLAAVLALLAQVVILHWQSMNRVVRGLLAVSAFGFISSGILDLVKYQMNVEWAEPASFTLWGAGLLTAVICYALFLTNKRQHG